MERNIFYRLLGAEAALCVVFSILQVSFSGAFSAAMAFPFEQIGLGLRMLSLSNDVGNAAAIVIYIAVSLSPVAALFVLSKKRKLNIEDGLLVLLSAILFVVFYLMINPGNIGMLIDGTVGQFAGKAALGIMVYSVLCGYLVLRVLRLFSVGGTDELVHYMSVMLHLLNVLFIYIVFSICIGSLFDSIATLKGSNVGNEHLLGTTYFFLVLQFLVDALPYLLNLIVVFSALELLREMRADRYSAETVAATERMSGLCAKVLIAMVLASMGFNLLQLLFAKSLLVINSLVQIPIFSITFVLAALLLTRFVIENKQLKDDNDMYI